MRECPTCGKAVDWQNSLFRPFCSERCKLVDLGKWVNEEYRVPGKPDSSNEKNDEPEEEDRDS